MEREYGEVYERLYKEHWWWRAREEFLLKQIATLEIPNQPHILDVGCGNGLFFSRLQSLGGTVEGIESDAQLITTSSNQHRIHIGPFDRSFNPAKRYALILMLDVIEHMDAPEEALAHAANMLLPHGHLIITVPAFRWLWTSHDDVNHHVTRYTKTTLQRAIAGTDLTFERLQYFFHWLVVPKLMVRLKESLVSNQAKPPQVPPPFLNRSVLRLSQWEQRLWGRWSLPLGSSLLGIARKKV